MKILLINHRIYKKILTTKEMAVIGLKFISWDQLYYLPMPTDEKLQLDELVIVKTPFGLDLGKIEKIMDLNFSEVKEDDQVVYQGKAEAKDLEKLAKENNENKKYLKICHELIKEHKLEMKLVDVHLALDSKKITYAFIADGRVDFRELVKDLVKKYKKAVRLQQLGVRDEVKYFGDVGPCGRQLCCQGHLQELGNVVSDYAKNQQVASRGAERLSGVCGRLKCCLAYEEKVYEDLNKKFPPLGSKIKVKEGEGTVVGYHTLKGMVDVEIGGEEEKKIVAVKV